MMALPNSDPVVDDVAGLEFVARRAREVKLCKIYSYGTITRRAEGREGASHGDPGLKASGRQRAFCASAAVPRHAPAFSGRPVFS